VRPNAVALLVKARRSGHEKQHWRAARIQIQLSTVDSSAYGATTAENDFNTYAERIFTGPENLVRLPANTHWQSRSFFL
jgi:hypothetical protein